VRSRARINDSGCIVGTATSSGSAPTTSVGGSNFLDSALAPADTFPVPASGSHGVLLIPLQLKLLNGSTPDFDGTIPTNVIASPENPNYANDVVGAGGDSQLGVLPMGQGRPTYPNDAYTVQTLVAAQAPSTNSAIQYQWERYLTRRSWYIQSTNSGASYYVTQRSSLGTTTPFNDTGSSNYYNTTPSSVKHEFYLHDTSAIAYGYMANDTNGYMPTGSYILEKKAFTYQVNVSFDGTNWTPGPSLPVEQITTIKYRSTAGTNAVSNWVGVPNLQGGNAFTYGKVVPVISSTDVQNITGSTNFTIAPTANN
jgi:hypothetical protein